MTGVGVALTVGVAGLVASALCLLGLVWPFWPFGTRRRAWRGLGLSALWAAVGLTGSVALAINAAQPDKPVQPSDVALAGIDRAGARAACRRAVLERATHPSTVEFEARLGRASFDAKADGTAIYAGEFTARNAFGLTLRYDVVCLFRDGRLIETLTAESKG